MDNQTKYLKWGMVGTAVAAIAYFVIPILLTMALSAVAIALCGLLLLSIWFALPAICEWLAQGSMWLWKSAIKADPISRMHRDLKAQGEDIAKLEENTAKCSAGIDQTRRSIQEGEKIMDPDVIRRWRADLEGLVQLRDSVMQVIKDEYKNYKIFEGLIKQAEAEMAIAKSMASTASLFDFAKKNGANSIGSKISFDEVAKRVSESRGRMQIALNRIQSGVVEKSHDTVTPEAPVALSAPSAPNVIDVPFRAAIPVAVSAPPASTGKKLGR